MSTNNKHKLPKQGMKRFGHRCHIANSRHRRWVNARRQQALRRQAARLNAEIALSPPTPP